MTGLHFVDIPAKLCGLKHLFVSAFDAPLPLLGRQLPLGCCLQWACWSFSLVLYHCKVVEHALAPRSTAGKQGFPSRSCPAPAAVACIHATCQCPSIPLPSLLDCRLHAHSNPLGQAMQCMRVVGVVCCMCWTQLIAQRYLSTLTEPHLAFSLPGCCGVWRGGKPAVEFGAAAAELAAVAPHASARSGASDGLHFADDDCCCGGRA